MWLKERLAEACPRDFPQRSVCRTSWTELRTVGIIEPGGSGFGCEQNILRIHCNHFTVRHVPFSLDPKESEIVEKKGSDPEKENKRKMVMRSPRVAGLVCLHLELDL